MKFFWALLLCCALPVWGQSKAVPKKKPAMRSAPLKKAPAKKLVPKKTVAKPEPQPAPEPPAEPLPEESPISWDVSGNLEGQVRALQNQSSAKRWPLLQDWEYSHFHVATGNLNVKAEMSQSRVEGNLFARYAASPLYGDGYLAPMLLNFPRKLVARDVFRLSHSRQDGDTQEDLILNKLYYELGGETARFSMGRLYINYGAGEIFNPVNPFNQPLGLVSSANVAQGNDGFKASFFASDDVTLNMYLLADKNLVGHEGELSKTLWLHGEWRMNEKVQLDYVAGEDLRRLKGGGQLNYILGDAMVFSQVLYSSALTDNQPSEPILDVLFGYDHQFTGEWHFRLEVGYQESDDRLALNNPVAAERFLPYERFVAIAQTYEVHPLVKLSATFIRDFDTDFIYGLARATVSIGENAEWAIFVNSPLYWMEEETNMPQRLFPKETGTALRVFF